MTREREYRSTSPVINRVVYVSIAFGHSRFTSHVSCEKIKMSLATESYIRTHTQHFMTLQESYKTTL